MFLWWPGSRLSAGRPPRLGLRTGGALVVSEHVVERTRHEQRKRRVFAIAAVAGSLVVVLSWLVRDSDDAFVTFVYPGFAVFLLAFAWLARVQRIPMRFLEGLGLVPLTLVIMARLAWLLHGGEPLPDRLLLLVGGHYWAVGILIVAGFLLLDRRQGLWYGAGIIGLSVLLVLQGSGDELFDTSSTQPLVFLLRVHAFLVLLLVLTAGVGTLRAQLHRALARAEAFEELARTDALTGLANRRSATELLEHEIQAHRRYGHDVSVITVDIDHFKTINDQHGHQRGDQILQAVATILADLVRDSDLVARWGGEEFLVVAPHTSGGQAGALAERCRQVIASAVPAGIELTATFGVATLAADETLDQLLSRADELLYAGKDAGRNRVHQPRTASLP